jgi:pimeloyl-ACP methyl ester carboxylesterase
MNRRNAIISALLASTKVQQEVVPDAGHWLMEESPAATVKLIAQFLRAAP